jgi:hypothetical protein
LIALKLAYLLTQYLYTNKRLDLPGIGTFLLDPAVIIDNENNKHRSSIPEGISFQSNSSIQTAPELIDFITAKSGKMKSLAESDLESHLQMVQQFLSLSKPFTFEGIGTLVKIKQGEYEFIPGNVRSDRPKENSENEVHGVTKKDTIEAKYQAYLATPSGKSRWRKPVIVLLILCGIGFAIWGGYTISTRQSEKTEGTLSEANTNEPILPLDSEQLEKPDTAFIQKPITQPDNYKYVLEIAKAKRAFNRFKTLKDSKLSNVVQLETKDSIQYKLFVLLPVTADTARVIDSLTSFLGKKVYIEHQN